MTSKQEYPCRLCGKPTENKIPIGKKYVRVCDDCKLEIYRQVRDKKILSFKF